MLCAESHRKDARRTRMVAEPISSTRVLVVTVDPYHDVTIFQYLHNRGRTYGRQIQWIDCFNFHAFAECISAMRQMIFLHVKEFARCIVFTIIQIMKNDSIKL